jgi:hypothetical protein
MRPLKLLCLKSSGATPSTVVFRFSYFILHNQRLCSSKILQASLENQHNLDQNKRQGRVYDCALFRMQCGAMRSATRLLCRLGEWGRALSVLSLL